ncbi:hypothetical protein G7Y79_00048g083740 [Physcia stellaris]|nr:hypothetical protein G7Y79_00048g083740 [Physcia stellaris]
MSGLKAGDSFPKGITFSYVPATPESDDSITSCGMPVDYDASKEFADKKVVLVAVPGAFTPACSVQHLPGYIEKYGVLKDKGVDIVAVISMNDAFVMDAWRKANNVKRDGIWRKIFLSDPGIAFSKQIGWTKGPERTGRYAMIIDHGKIVYAEKEPGGDVTVSGADSVLAKL